MPTTPTGSISLAAEYLAAALADCAAFRTWCGADDATQARGRIYFDALPPPADREEHTLDELHTLRPYVLIYSRTFARQHISTSDNRDFGSEGSMGVEFFADVPVEIHDNPAEISQRFNNDLGGILDELCDRSGRAGFLAFTRVSMEEPPVRTSKDEEKQYGDAMFVRVIVDWSDNA